MQTKDQDTGRGPQRDRNRKKYQNKDRERKPDIAMQRRRDGRKMLFKLRDEKEEILNMIEIKKFSSKPCVKVCCGQRVHRD